MPMLEIKSLSDSELEKEIKSAVEKETATKIHILHLLAEVERRRLYSKRHPSLFEFCVKTLKYSAGAAQRRIDTMRAMKLVPEIESKIVSGELNLASISQAQCFFRQEAKTGKVHSIESKKEIFKKLENKSVRECVKELVTLSPLAIPEERRRRLTSEKVELRIVVDETVVIKLDKIKALLSHKKSHLTDAELLNEMADLVLKKLDPEIKSHRVKKESMKATDFSIPLPAPAVDSRYISKSLKKAIFQRDRSQCTHPGCASNYFLEIDHIKPLALGGTTTFDNLRLLCRTHNQKAAIDVFGVEHMEKFFSKERQIRDL